MGAIFVFQFGYMRLIEENFRKRMDLEPPLSPKTPMSGIELKNENRVVELELELEFTENSPDCLPASGSISERIL